MDSSGSPGPSAPHADAFEEPMDTTSDGDAQDVTDEARAFDEGTREAMAPSDDEDVDELSGLRAKAAGGKPKGAARGPSDDTRDKVADAFIQSTLMTVTGAGEQSMALPALSRKKADQEQQERQGQSLYLLYAKVVKASHLLGHAAFQKRVDRLFPSSVQIKGKRHVVNLNVVMRASSIATGLALAPLKDALLPEVVLDVEASSKDLQKNLAKLAVDCPREHMCMHACACVLLVPIMRLVHAGSSKGGSKGGAPKDAADADPEDDDAAEAGDDDADADETENVERQQPVSRYSLTSKAEVVRVTDAMLALVHESMKEPQQSEVAILIRTLSVKLSKRIPVRPRGVSTSMHQLLDMASQPDFRAMADSALRSISAKQGLAQRPAA